MHTIKVSPKLTVAAQPDLAEFPAIALDGYALVINNRPDGEDPTQPGTEAEAEAAGQYQLAYLHLPIGAAPLTEADIRAFQRRGRDGRRSGAGALPQRHPIAQRLGHRRSA